LTSFLLSSVEGRNRNREGQMKNISPKALLMAVLLLAVLLIMIPVSPGSAQDKPLEIKLVTLAPMGTSPHVALLKMGEQWQKLSGGKVRLSVIGSYRAGGEAAMVDKMGVGGIDGALMTIVGLSKISKDAMGMSAIPMIYRSLEEVDYVEEKFGTEVSRAAEQKGFVVLFWTDIGWIRHFSAQPLVHPQDLKGMKMFVWAGSPEQVDMMKGWGTNPVSLEPSDILSALSTGMINIVSATPFSANAGQYARVAKHMLEVNWCPLTGGAVMRKQVWDKIPGELRQEFLKVGAETGKEIKGAGRKESDEAVEVMKKKQGLKVTVPSAQINEEWRRAMIAAYPKIRGSIVTAESFDRIESILRGYDGKGTGNK
jgi:TRAP-type C4-dicarboxylate transport system substrate-binding protein